MYLSNLATLDRDAATLPANIQKGLKFLAETDIAALPAGRVDIEGDTIFALIQDYDTAPKAEKRPESHARYIDIQYVFSGREIIGYAPIAFSAPVHMPSSIPPTFTAPAVPPRHPARYARSSSSFWPDRPAIVDIPSYLEE
jgi:hypothetical protein